MNWTIDARPLALGTALVLLVTACTGSEADPSPAPGAPVPVDAAATAPVYSPVSTAALLYGLPSAVSGKRLVESPPDVLEADEAELAGDPLIRSFLINRGLDPEIITVVQRGTDYTIVPDVSVTAVQFKGLPAADFATFVPSVYLLATSVTIDQHNLTGAKPARYETEIEGRVVHASDWGAFDVVWFPYGDVIYIVLAKNPQLLASALRSLPPLGLST